MDSIPHSIGVFVPPAVMQRLLKSATVETLSQIYGRNRDVDTLIRAEVLSRVESFFGSYFNSLSEFRACLRAARAVVSGSSLLKIIHLIDKWINGDVDIYLPFDGDRLLDDFLTSQGYTKTGTFDMEDTPNEYRNTGIRYIHSYVRNGKLIQCIVSNGADSILPITSFWATTLFSILSADELVIAYPQDVFNRVGRIMPAWSDIEHVASLQAKYMERGYSIVKTESSFQDPPKTRYFGDDSCVILGYGLEEDKAARGLVPIVRVLNPALLWREVA
ncbi:hypothetical protein NLI96_g7133 [Meripilus lineatus]|uniref:Uncharacterized protein n=1 Tax=Meripilus lineatus TaxID=2056292 RepID=A0AAD5V043_9APHY|nr:hypothetical protein NLI96_g7133 [Physisporinus lineatus]